MVVGLNGEALDALYLCVQIGGVSAFERLAEAKGSRDQRDDRMESRVGRMEEKLDEILRILIERRKP